MGEQVVLGLVALVVAALVLKVFQLERELVALKLDLEELGWLAVEEWDRRAAEDSEQDQGKVARLRLVQDQEEDW